MGFGFSCRRVYRHSWVLGIWALAGLGGFASGLMGSIRTSKSLAVWLQAFGISGLGFSFRQKITETLNPKYELLEALSPKPRNPRFRVCGLMPQIATRPASAKTARFPRSMPLTRVIDVGFRFYFGVSI